MVPKDNPPDWAVILENDKRIYFVAETKGTLDRQLLREVENMKIACGEKHFALFKPLGVEYKLAVMTKDLYKKGTYERTIGKSLQKRV
jgi:type III restriction enzyme